jgi:hypothetical protein
MHGHLGQQAGGVVKAMIKKFDADLEEWKPSLRLDQQSVLWLGKPGDYGTARSWLASCWESASLTRVCLHACARNSMCGECVACVRTRRQAQTATSGS